MNIIGRASKAEIASAAQRIARLGTRPGQTSKVAFEGFVTGLIDAPAGVVIACAEQLVGAGEAALAAAALDRVLTRRGYDHDLHYCWAWTFWQGSDLDRAESIARILLRRSPDSLRGALLLAEVLRAQGRLQACAGVLREFSRSGKPDSAGLHAVASFLNNSRSYPEALEICEITLQAGENASLHALAASLCLTLGRFEDSRRHGLAALDLGASADEFRIPHLLSMCQRYSDAGHPDFELFRQQLDRVGTAVGKASILFAMGKAADDLQDFTAATTAFRGANPLLSTHRRWRPDAWQASLTAQTHFRRDATAAPAETASINPVFIVGMPRSGSTLLASRLAQHPAFRDRGELPTLPFISRRLLESGRCNDPAALRQSADLYLVHLRQDDELARWYIDKAPMNFVHTRLIARLFPEAKILWCRRDRRDTALSIWTQAFAGPELDFSRDFSHLLQVTDDCDALMTQAATSGASPPILEVHYEKLVTDSTATLNEIFHFLGAPAFPSSFQPVHGPIRLPIPSPIATSSAWQARQPIHDRSIGRWKAYQNLIPELGRF